MDETQIIKSLEKTLDALLPIQKGPLEKLYEGARYIVFAPSKRIRPLFIFAVANHLNTPISKALYPACALEFIHTYSLIHDDLPCMDDDDMRRGQPSLHKVYDEATALLIGDFLLTLSFEVLAKAPDLTSDQKLELIQILSEYAGGQGMIGGQLMDLQKVVPSSQVHKYKTAALFSAAFRFGATIANASAKKKEEMQKLGEKTGLLFQIVDDIHDGDCPSLEVGISQANSLYQEIMSFSENSPFIEHLINKIYHSMKVHT